MSNWNRYAPDHNPPPGMPKGYPYALNPNPPPVNPMYPSPSAGYLPNSSAYPPNTSGSPYPGGSSPYSSNSSTYPPSSSPYPPDSSPYPPNSSPYSPNSSPYSPNSSPYPSNSSPYPPNSSTYPSESSPYPPESSPYSSGSSPYPSGFSPQFTGSSPYPTGSSPYPPTTSYPAAQSPYPSASSPYPGGAAQSPGRSPYSANFSPYTTGLPSHSKSGPQTHFNPSHTHSPGIYHKKMAYYIVGDGTVKAFPNFDPKLDAEALRKAMKGFGTDEKAIIHILANRSNEQRVYIGVAFKQLYGKDLIDDLKSELSGNFERVILALMMPTHDYLASELHDAISGIGTKEDVLIEVLCSRTNQEIWSINEAYRRLYDRNLEDDIKGDTSGHFERLLVSACTGARSEDPADSERAKQTAQALYEAGAGQWGTDESVFNSILVAESFQQLAHTFYEYQKLAGHTVAEAIDSELSGDLKKGMLTIGKCVENRPLYFAEKLYKAMKGLGTDDNTLIRIVVSRCEIDMVQIKAEYERNYGKPLVDAIKGDTSGDYKRVLIALVEPY